MTRAATRVLKLGGSLLTDFEVWGPLAAWLSGQSPRATLVVVGGGELAEGVRDLDRRYGLTAEAAHWQAVRAMQVNAFIVHRLWRESTWVQRLHQWQAQEAAVMRVGILDPLAYLTLDEPRSPGAPLPHNWDATSDSVAARLANGLERVELVLLKSTLPAGVGETITCQQAADAGLVDEHFPIAARALKSVRAIDLRAPSWPEVRLIDAS